MMVISTHARAHTHNLFLPLCLQALGGISGEMTMTVMPPGETASHFTLIIVSLPMQWKGEVAGSSLLEISIAVVARSLPD